MVYVFDRVHGGRLRERRVLGQSSLPHRHFLRSLLLLLLFLLLQQGDVYEVFLPLGAGEGIGVDTDLLEDDNLVGCLQVLKLVGYQDTKLVLQQTADTPEDTRTVSPDLCVHGAQRVISRAQARRTLSYFWGSSSFPNRMLLRIVPGNTQGCWAAQSLNRHTWILRMLTRLSNSFSMALGKKSVTVSRTAVYSDTVTNTRLAVMVFPSRT
ncbi:hypothetical protein F7725_009230 [Dissostichus mawsoni]|uniref:Uncharacterized protein n=1 Tax=Dissostichus mawsoni TaxID=36200 RepID=A0A7J5Z8A3_DISMA|nr:hypothetical protein F7725_009230 [Dissostichus mawsoni]